MTKRFQSLDGLRGLAVLLVVFFHLNREININSFFPTYLQSISKSIFGGGQVGVDIFFLLSGFLIAYIFHEVPEFWGYISKRWARIFPVFWATVIFASTVFLSKNTNIFIVIFQFSLIIFSGFILKNLFIKNYHKRVFWIFIIMQIAISGLGILYSLTINQLFLDSHHNFRLFVSVISNLTLTVPFFARMEYIDGAYWTLQSEIIFYFVYPILIIPFFRWVKNIKTFWQILLLVTVTFTTSVALHLLNQHILNLSLISVHRSFGLILGALIGYFWRKKLDTNSKTIHFTFFESRPSLIKIYQSKVFQLFTIFILPFVVWRDADVRFHDATLYDHYSRSFLLIPLVIVFLIALDENSWLHKILSGKILLFLGSISYSWYLSHNSVIKIATNTINFDSPSKEMTSFVLIFTISILVAFIFKQVFENMYFENKSSFVANISTCPSYLKIVFKNLGKMIICISEFVSSHILILLIVIGLSISTFTFVKNDPQPFTLTEYLSKDDMNNIAKIGIAPIRIGEKISGEMTASMDNFGIILFLIEYIDEHQNLHPEGGSKNNYVFRLKKKGEDALIVESRKNLNSIYGWYPIGFPLITNSAYQSYIWELEVEGNEKSQFLRLQKNDNFIKMRYLIDKKRLVRDMSYLFQFLLKKLEYGILTDNIKITLFAAWLPTILFTLFIYSEKSSKS